MGKNECNHSETRREDWGSPSFLVEWLRDIGFDFKIDLAASRDNAISDWFVTKEMDFLSGKLPVELIDALETCWSWCNPPYETKGLGRWVEKLAEVPNIVALISASPGSKWFRTVWSAYDYVVFLDGRLTFVGAPQGAQFDSVLAIRGDILTQKQIRALGDLGTVVDCSSCIQATGWLRDTLKEQRKAERKAKREEMKNEGSNSDDPGCICADPVSCHCGCSESASETGDGDSGRHAGSQGSPASCQRDL